MSSHAPIAAFNDADVDHLRDALAHCCAATRWVDAMMQARPFASEAALYAASATTWASLGEADYLQAFDAHPKIGDPDSLKAKYRATLHMASSEQSSVQVASDATLEALARDNQLYEKRFGFIFIVCATGKSADEMLALLQARLPNTRDAEVRNAAAEQLKITHIRLAQLLQTLATTD